MISSILLGPSLFGGAPSNKKRKTRREKYGFKEFVVHHICQVKGPLPENQMM
ncbi:MAG: hypothetical protein QW493_02530 [Candidatus Bathyarchaeia archaeon]